MQRSRSYLTMVVIILFSLITTAAYSQPPCNMSGIYSIGPNGSFNSLTAAINKLKLDGMGGNVILELSSDYTSNAETFPITFPRPSQIPCLGNKKLTVRPASNVSNVSIEAAIEQRIIVLDSTNYLTIDGRPGGAGTTKALTIINHNRYYTIQFKLACNNKFKFVKIGGGNLGSMSGYVIEFNAGSDNNVLESCDLYSLGKTIITAHGTPGTWTNNNDSIINCNFYGFQETAIQIYEGNDGWVIQNNSFFSSPASYVGDVAIIDIYSPNTIVPYIISGNHFGGTAPGGTGDVMQVAYSSRFYFIDVRGGAQIYDNRFVRMKFLNTISNANIEIGMIYIDPLFNNIDEKIFNNQFGGVNIQDSLHFTAGHSNNIVVLNLINNWNYGARILNNRFDHIRCYSANGGTIALAMINGGSYIEDNKIGSPSIYNSIINHTNRSTYGIQSGGGRIHRNFVSRMTSTSTGSNASLGGINSSNSVDSISNNTVCFLENRIGTNSLLAGLCGISGGSTAQGGLDNMISDNLVYNLVNRSAGQGGKIIGLSAGGLNIHRNFIHNLVSIAPVNTPIIGISTDNMSTLENNFVRLGIDSNGNSQSAGTLTFTGITGGSYLKHNTVYIGGTMTSAGIGTHCYTFNFGASTTRFFNNIFYNARSNADGALTAKHRCVSIAQIQTADNNLYYYSGIGGALGIYNGNSYTTFAQWKTGTGKDLNSIFADPLLANPAAASGLINLRLKYGSPAEAAGGVTHTTTRDFDHETRSALTPVDIGADAGMYGSCPEASLGPDRTMIAGDSIQLGNGSSMNQSYTWSSSPAGFISSQGMPYVSPAVTTQYFLTVSNGCVDKDTITINVLPSNPTLILCPGGNGTIVSTIAGTLYAWEIDGGGGYLSVTDNIYHSGSNTSTLQLSNIPSSFYGVKYRCVVDGINDIHTIVKIENVWTGAVNTLWTNPGNWSCNSVPDGNTDVYINSGPVILNANGIVRSLHIAPGVVFTVNPGVTLTITH